MVAAAMLDASTYCSRKHGHALADTDRKMAAEKNVKAPQSKLYCFGTFFVRAVKATDSAEQQNNNGNTNAMKAKRFVAVTIGVHTSTPTALQPPVPADKLKEMRTSPR